MNDDEVARARSYDDVAGMYEHVNAPIFFDGPALGLVEFAAVERGERVLDVGAGTGAVSRAVLTAGGEVVALDIAVNMLMAAQRGGVSNLVCNAVPELPFVDDVFDAVLSAFVLTHVEEPDAAVDEMRRVLRPGGRIALSSWSPADDVYAAACAEIVAEFIDPVRIAEAATRVLPGESRFAQPDGLSSILNAHGLRDVHGEIHTFEFVCSVEDLVASREVCASGRTLRTLLSDEEWRAYRARSLDVLGRKFPSGIRYPRRVIFAVGHNS